MTFSGTTRLTLPSEPSSSESGMAARDVKSWLCRRPDDLTEDERPKLKAILDRCPELHAASAQVRAFAAVITGLTGHDLPRRIASAREAGLPGIASFAKGLEHDIDAVPNGLTMPWSSGPVEGRVNHIKWSSARCSAGQGSRSSTSASCSQTRTSAAPGNLRPGWGDT